MTCILIEDILDQFRDENRRLFNENQVIHKLLDKYRLFSLNVKNSCICDQNSDNVCVIQSLEDEYQSIGKQSDNQMIKCEKSNESLDKEYVDSKYDINGRNEQQISDNSEDELNERSGTGLKVKEINSDYVMSDGNDRRLSKQYFARLQRFGCSYEGCGRRFDRSSKLNFHIESAHTLKAPEDQPTIDSSHTNLRQRSERVLRSNQKNFNEDIDSDYEASVGNDTQISDSEEEKSVQKTSRKRIRFKDKVCPYDGCGHKTRDKRRLEEHIQRYHTFEKPFRCDQCDQSFVTKRRLEDHMSVHSGLSFECEECHKVFNRKLLLTYHKRIHNYKIVCPENGCGFTAYRNSKLTLHNIQVHKKTPPLNQKKKKANCEPSEFECDFEDCHKVFMSRERLNYHKKYTHTTERFHCDWIGCEKTFKLKKSYSEHKRTHSASYYETNEWNDTLISGFDGVESSGNTSQRRGYRDKLKNNVCPYDVCGHKTRDKRQLEEHIQRYHTFEKPFQCDECDQSFVTKKLLKDHLSIHLGLTFECEECHKVFNRKLLLTYHKRIHQNKIVCPQEGCGFTAYRNSQLTHHNIRVHKISPSFIESEETTNCEPLELKCDYEDCHQVFKSSGQLNYHKRYIHTTKRFHCDWPGCELSYKTKAHYDVHKRAHLNSRTYKCKVEGCGKAFNYAQNLSVHKAHHEKRFVCEWPECGQRLGTKNSLNTHKNKHLNVKPFKCKFDGCPKEYFDSQCLRKHHKYYRHNKSK